MVLNSPDTASAVKLLTNWKGADMASSIRSIAPRRARAIAFSYNELKITGEVGTTRSRFLVFAAFILLIVVLWTLITRWLLDPLSQMMGLFSVLFFLGAHGGIHAFFVNVPKLAAVITTNKFAGGRNHVFVTGFWGNIKFPWETYSYTEDFISMRPYVLEKTTAFLTKDGVTVIIRWSISIGPVPQLLLLFVRTDSGEMDSAFSEVAESALSSIILEKNAADLRSPSTIDEIYERLEFRLSNGKDRLGNSIEERYGSSVEIPAISPPTFEKDYTEAMMAEVVMGIIEKNAKQMATNLGIPPGEALNAVMILNKEDIKKVINEVTAGANLVEVLKDVLGKLGLTVDEWLKQSRQKSTKKTPPNKPTNKPNDNKGGGSK